MAEAREKATGSTLLVHASQSICEKLDLAVPSEWWAGGGDRRGLVQSLVMSDSRRPGGEEEGSLDVDIFSNISSRT